MLAFLSGRMTYRKTLLYLCAGLRQLWVLLYSRGSQEAVEVFEREADGLASEHEINRAAWSAEVPTFGFDFEARYAREQLERSRGYPTAVTRLLEMGVYTEDDLQKDGPI